MPQQVGKDKTKLEPIKELFKAPPCSDVPESSHAASKESTGKLPYCYRCFTKGHTIQQCIAVVYCDVRAVTAHMTAW